jgi:hypothetical protein
VAAGGAEVGDDERVSPVLERDGAVACDLELRAGNILVECFANASARATSPANVSVITGCSPRWSRCISHGRSLMPANTLQALLSQSLATGLPAS